MSDTEDKSHPPETPQDESQEQIGAGTRERYPEEYEHFKKFAEKFQKEKTSKPLPADDEKVTLSFRVEGKVLKDILYVTRRMGMTKSEFIRSAIESWITEAFKHLEEESQKMRHLRERAPHVRNSEEFQRDTEVPF